MYKFLIILVVFVVLAFVGINIGNNPKQDKLVIYFPIDKDFINSDKGTAVFRFSFPETGFKVGDKDADILMFLDSETIPGLKIQYNQKENKIYAGIPSLVTEEVIILDGKDHKIEYTFNSNEKQQTLSLDGTLLASGEYTGGVTVLTGYAVYEQFKYIESNLSMEVNFK